MHFQQVALAVLAFSSARGGTFTGEARHPVGGVMTIIPPMGHSKIVVEQDNQDNDSWYVRLVRTHTRRPMLLEGPIYFPAVSTQEGLVEALTKAWEYHRQQHPLSRSIEPSPPKTPLQSASPARQQRAVSPQSPPRRE